MKFKDNEIIGNEKNINWYQLLKKVRALSMNGNQWIYRALGKWEGQEISIASSFDDVWKHPTKEKETDKRKLYESWMLLEFKREAYRYLNNLPERKNFLEWLALARHFGMPSRIVDFSYSFYVATYFALSTKGRRFKIKKGKKLYEDKDGCILAINLTWMKEQVEKKLKNKWCRESGVSYDKASFHNKKLFQYFVFNSSENYVVPVNPLRRNPRMAKQHGLFLCPSNIEKGFDGNLQNTLKGKQGVKKLIRLQSNLRSDAICDLRKMNISLATLYPDLSGWARSQQDLVHLDISDDRLIKELRIALSNPSI